MPVFIVCFFFVCRTSPLSALAEWNLCTVTVRSQGASWVTWTRSPKLILLTCLFMTVLCPTLHLRMFLLQSQLQHPPPSQSHLPLLPPLPHRELSRSSLLLPASLLLPLSLTLTHQWHLCPLLYLLLLPRSPNLMWRQQLPCLNHRVQGALMGLGSTVAVIQVYSWHHSLLRRLVLVPFSFVSLSALFFHSSSLFVSAPLHSLTFFPSPFSHSVFRFALCEIFLFFLMLFSGTGSYEGESSQTYELVQGGRSHTDLVWNLAGQHEVFTRQKHFWYGLLLVCYEFAEVGGRATSDRWEKRRLEERKRKKCSNVSG